MRVSLLAHLENPQKVPGLSARPLKRRFLYSQLARLVSGAETLAGEAEETRRWRLLAYGPPTVVDEREVVVRPPLVPAAAGGGGGRVRRRQGAELHTHIEFDLPSQQEPDEVDRSFAPAEVKTTNKAAVPQLPLDIPKRGRARQQLENLLRENAHCLLRLKLLKTWYTEAELKVLPEYGDVVKQIEQNFCEMING